MTESDALALLSSEDSTALRELTERIDAIPDAFGKSVTPERGETASRNRIRKLWVCCSGVSGIHGRQEPRCPIRLARLVWQRSGDAGRSWPDTVGDARRRPEVPHRHDPRRSLQRRRIAQRIRERVGLDQPSSSSGVPGYGPETASSRSTGDGNAIIAITSVLRSKFSERMTRSKLLTSLPSTHSPVAKPAPTGCRRATGHTASRIRMEYIRGFWSSSTTPTQ